MNDPDVRPGDTYPFEGKTNPYSEFLEKWTNNPDPEQTSVTREDLDLVMEACDLRLKEGRLIEPRAAEIILSEEIVRALSLQIGDLR